MGRLRRGARGAGTLAVHFAFIGEHRQAGIQTLQGLERRSMALARLGESLKRAGNFRGNLIPIGFQALVRLVKNISSVWLAATRDRA